MGNDTVITPPCPFNQKNLTWTDNFDIIRKENEDNFTVTLIN